MDSGRVPHRSSSWVLEVVQMQVLLAISAATWLAIGVVLSVMMGRRGHDAYAWLILGMFLGPIALVLAVYTDRSPTGEAS